MQVLPAPRDRLGGDGGVGSGKKKLIAKCPTAVAGEPWLKQMEGKGGASWGSSRADDTCLVLRETRPRSSSISYSIV